MKTSIVIPAYNGWNLLHQLLFDIYKQQGNLHEVIIVNDCSTEKDFVDGLEWWKSQNHLSLSVIKNETNSGFLLTANKGLKRATGDIVILVSTDVRIYPGALEIIQKRLEMFPKTLISGKVYRESTGWNKIDEKVYPYAEGFLLATTREGWKELDYFDERYVPNDVEDVDLSTTALSKGWELYELPLDAVRHIGAQTIGYGEEREALTHRNINKFREKWVDE